MFDRIIAFSIKNKLLIGLLTCILIGWGIYSFQRLPIDAVPDITNNQVVVITQSPNLAALEIERYISYPIELATANIPQLQETRSLSRFGLSVVTLVFDDDADIYWARNQVSEKLKSAAEMIQPGLGTPKLAPVSTGLSEIFQYTIQAQKGYESTYSLTDLRTIQDWNIRRELLRVKGVADVSSFGGYQKQYQIQINPDLLKSHGILISDVYESIEKSSANTGAAYIEKDNQVYFIRGIGMMQNQEDLENTLIKNQNGIPVLVKDVAQITIDGSVRYGAMTVDGKGESAGGILLMLKGENASQVIDRVKEKMKQIESHLPKGLKIETFIDREKLVDNAIHTVSKNLIEGGLIVILVLTLLLGNIRAGFIVASVIPLCMMFAFALMVSTGISGNLMSLGAIDFGLIVDGAVIIVEYVISSWLIVPQRISDPEESESIMIKTIARIRNSSMFGELIILIVYIPILSLGGIEGKMFRPMALTVLFAISGAFLLSLTYVPVMCSLFLKNISHSEDNFADKIIKKLKGYYFPVLNYSLKNPLKILASTLALFIASGFLFMHLGGEFIPELNEGDYAVETRMLPGTSLSQSIDIATKVERVLLDSFPNEIISCVSKIGTAEIATDPMPIEAMDVIISLKPIDQWKRAASKEELDMEISRILTVFPGVHFSLQQPIQMRFNELMTSAKTDVVVRLFGDNLDTLSARADEIAHLAGLIDGAADIQVQRLGGLPQIQIHYNRKQMAVYGLNVQQLNDVIQSSFSGRKAGVLFEEEKGFDIVVRLDKNHRNSLADIENLMVACPNGAIIPIKTLADVSIQNGPAEISRENGKRRIHVGFNIRGRSVEDVVSDLNKKMKNQLHLPQSYYYEFGGAFENLQHAIQRLIIVLPVALIIILFLLYLSFQSVMQSALVFTCIPLAAIGGIISLGIRSMPFSISAGVGFIALFGVAVLNGLVLMSYFNEVRKNTTHTLDDIIRQVLNNRFRPVIITALVASIGFLPMAFSNGVGAEVQKPLATVVIGGLITSTLLTLILLPVLLQLVYQNKNTSNKMPIIPILILSGICFSFNNSFAQNSFNLTQLIESAKLKHPQIKAADAGIKAQEKLAHTAFALPDLDVIVESPTGSDFRPALLQNFDFPTVYLNQKKQYQTLTQRARLTKQFNVVQLVAAIKKEYAQALYSQDLLKLLQDEIRLYDSLDKKCEKLYRAGEIRELEWLHIQNQLAYLKGKEVSLEADIKTAIANLYLYSSVDTTQAIKVERMNIAPLPPANGDNGLYAEYFNTIEREAHLQYRQSIHRAIPGFAIGYFNQGDANEPDKYKWQAGIRFPILFWEKYFQISSAKQKYKQAKFEHVYRFNSNQTAIQNSYLKLEADYKNLLYYQTTALALADRSIEKSYLQLQAGEINYISFVQLLDKAYRIKESALEAERNYQQEYTQFNYLKGEE